MKNVLEEKIVPTTNQVKKLEKHLKNVEREVTELQNSLSSFDTYKNINHVQNGRKRGRYVSLSAILYSHFQKKG